MGLHRNGRLGLARRRTLVADVDAGSSGGGIYGYKLHAAVCTRTGLPVAWRTESANHHEALYALPLLDAVHGRGFSPETCAMDKGYDSRATHDALEARDCQPKAVWIKADRRNPIIPREAKRGVTCTGAAPLSKRELGRLKHAYGLASLRVRGLDRVVLHADLTMLARLAQALARARAVPLAA